MKNPLVDQEFLRKLDLQRNKATYAKIILLTFDEEPVEEIQGRITQGSINIDGNSAVRRTCSLTMVFDKVDINNTYWALKNKFKLEVGVENTVDSQYPDVIWFKQGTYVFTSLNMSVQSNNFTISINGKDKMCLLNGEVGGMINASTDFGKLEEYSTLSNGEIVRDVINIPIVDIIKNAVHVYGGQPLSNIVLNDIDNYGLELLNYRVKGSNGNDKPMFMLRNIKTNQVTNMTFATTYDGCTEDGSAKEYNFNDDFKYYNTTQGIAGLNTDADIVYVKIGNEVERYNVIRITYGMTAGYRMTELTYPGELVANVGESLVTILDKIKNMFSDFEYFFDVDGRFIFQKKKTYINTSFNNLTKDDDEIYAEDAAYTSSTVYSFENGTLLTAFTNAPQILNIKNDYSIWGKRKGVSGADLPIHLRYAIGIKPTYYKPLRFDDKGDQLLNIKAFVSFEYREYEKIDLTKDNFVSYMYYIKNLNGTYQLADTYNEDMIYYRAVEDKERDENLIYVDWRELIYQMALDYFKYNHKKDNFTQLIAENNPDHYPTGITGYEAFYTDLQAFWRQIYHPGVEKEEFITSSELKQLAREYWLELKNSKDKIDLELESADELENYIKGSSAQAGQIVCLNQKDKNETSIYYLFSEYDGEKLKLTKIDVTTSVTEELIDNIIELHMEDLQAILCQEYNSDYWNKNVSESPETLNFWFDFMSVEGDMAKYSIQTIGNRPKAVNNDKVTAIYFQETPTVLFIDSSSETIDYTGLSGYTYIQLTDTMENYFSISAQGKSAMDELDSLLYQHTHAAEAVTLTTVPIYHLQPNTRIFVKDDNTGINGEYIVSKITIPLQYNGTTSITTTKAVDRIY